MKLLIALLACLAALVSCGKPPTLDPPQVRWGQDVCVECSMILSDDRYAGAIVVIENNERQIHLFDDIGEMIASKTKYEAPFKRWTCDAQTRQWIDADTAFYVRSPKLHTPMGYGVAAFGQASQAQKKQNDVDGELLRFDDFATPVKHTHPKPKQ